jgi:hypothetical protein
MESVFACGIKKRNFERLSPRVTVPGAAEKIAIPFCQDLFTVDEVSRKIVPGPASSKHRPVRNSGRSVPELTGRPQLTDHQVNLVGNSCAHL